MRTAPLPPDEAARLLELARYDILDTPAEEAFDRITRLAARLLAVPIAILNFVDQSRHWRKASTGIESYELPRADSPCAWTIVQDGPLAVPDLRLDQRFHDLHAVQDGCRMYAGTALRTPGGQRIGTLCVVDTAPRILSEADLQVLQDLAAMAMSELELRRHTHELRHQIAAQSRHLVELRRDLAHAQTLEAVTALGETDGAPEETVRQAADLLGQAIAADWTGLLTVRDGHREVRPVRSRPGLPAGVERLARHPGQGGRGGTDGGALPERSMYVDRYEEQEQTGAQAGAWIPLGTWDGTTAVLVVLRASDESRRSPWRESDRALLEAAGRSVRAALARRQTLEAAAQASRRDALTGTNNRRALEEELAAVTAGAPLTLVLMDLDGFKALNDSAGHAEGDRALRLFAGALEAEFAGDGQVYRLGGDEFVLTLPGLWTSDELQVRLDLAVGVLRQTVGAPLGVSMGAATTRETDRADLLVLADTRMYQAKRRRKALELGGGR